MSRASEFLISQFQIRKNRNQRFSQGAFARQLGINSGRVAQYFSGKRAITKSAAVKFSEKLGLDEEQKDYFVHLCEIDKRNRKAPMPELIENDKLSLLVEWHHLAVFYLILTKDFVLDHAWMARRLNIPEELVTASMERLERVGLIEIVDGKVFPKRGAFTTPTGIPNKFLEMSHKDIFRYMESNMSQLPLHRRDVSSITLAIDDSKLDEARELVRSFRRKLADLMSEGKKNQVYTINIQLFPLTGELS